MSFGDDFGSNWLNATAFGPIGTRKPAVINRVVRDLVGPEQEPKWIAHLTGSDGEPWKGLPLNKTNGRALISYFGKDPAAYSGKHVEVCCEATSFGSSTVGGLRIYLPAATSATAASGA